jgi:hypothetical protein
LTSRRLRVAKFVDSEHLSDLESLLIHICPKECHIPAASSDAIYPRLVDLLVQFEVSKIEHPSSSFKSLGLGDALQILLAKPSNIVPDLDETTSGALNCILNELNVSIFPFAFYGAVSFPISIHSIRAL